MSEADILKRIMRLSTGDVRLFRNNVGKAWMGHVIKKTATTVTLERPRLVSFGIPGKGGSDLIGWRGLVITPDMVGLRIAQFVSLEAKMVKRSGELEQVRWLATVDAFGGLAALVRSEEEAAEQLQRPLR